MMAMTGIIVVILLVGWLVTALNKRREKKEAEKGFQTHKDTSQKADDTINEECRVELRLTNKQTEEVPWMEMKEAREEMHYHFRKLPCDGLCQMEKDSNQEGDSWSYLRSWNVVWLIKNLYGMEGVWQLSLYQTECRS